MRLFSFVCVAGTLCVFGWITAARADNDISPRVVGGRIATFGYDDDLTAETATELRVFDFGFDPAVDANSTTDPGIHALSTDFAATFGTGANHIVASGLPDGSKIAFDVISKLQLWNGAAFVPVSNGDTLQLSFGPASITVGTGAGFYPGFTVGTVGGAFGDQGFHEHLTSTTVAGAGHANPLDGIYAFQMQLRLLSADNVTPYPGIANSLPFFVLYDHDSLDMNDPIDAAISYAQTVVPEPSTCVLAGLGGMLLIGAGMRSNCLRSSTSIRHKEI
jgi:hypothetical protein